MKRTQGDRPTRIRVEKSWQALCAQHPYGTQQQANVLINSAPALTIALTCSFIHSFTPTCCIWRKPVACFHLERVRMQHSKHQRAWRLQEPQSSGILNSLGRVCFSKMTLVRITVFVPTSMWHALLPVSHRGAPSRPTNVPSSFNGSNLFLEDFGKGASDVQLMSFWIIWLHALEQCK
jgi:hypothetical protein